MVQSLVSNNFFIKMMQSSRAFLLWAGFAAVCASGQTPKPVFSTGQAARMVIGQKNFTLGDFGGTNTLLGSPSGIAFANGVLWVVDSNRLGGSPNNNRVLRFSDVATFPGATADPTIFGSTCGVCRGSADLVLGQPDFVSYNSSLTASGVRSPTAVATDGKVVAVADTDNNRVLIWQNLPRVSGQPADNVIGQRDMIHNATSVPPTATSLRGPSGVWIYNGKLFVADTQDNRILIYNKIPTSNNVAADVVLGQPNFTTFIEPDLTQKNATPTANNMQTPVSVTTDGQRLFVADEAQNRILIWNTIPTTNGAAADIALGQPNVNSAISNYSYTINSATVDADNNPTDITPVLCSSTAAYAATLGQTGANAVDTTTGTKLYPPRCAATLSLPRFALSDGTRLFVADGGNDRVLVYNSIPTASGQPADAVLGEPDEFSDNTGQNPDGTDAFQTPVSLAFDGLNLYVGDTYNRRVLIYTPGFLNIPLGGARNAASLNIYAIGSVQIAGGIAAKDTITITINGTDYLYTIVATDTLTTVAENLAKAINKVPGDPNVVASVDDITNTVVLTARAPGAPGGNITLKTTSSANAQIVGQASGANLNIYLQNPTSIAPGTLIEITGQNLCHATAAADFIGDYLPFTLNGCEVYIDGQRAPLLYVSPNQINAQMHLEYTDRTSVSLYARDTLPDGTINVTSPIAITVVPQNPGIFAQFGTDPRPGLVYHASANANDAIAFDGVINAGDQLALTIASADGSVTNTYNYTVLASDTLDSVRDAVAVLINNAPDPLVTASPINEFHRMLLSAIQPGQAGEGIAITQAVTGTNASLIVTVLNPTTCCDNTAGALVTEDNPAVPGEVVYLFATGLGPTSPSDLDTGRIYKGGANNPPAVPVDSILVGGTAANILNVTPVPGTVGVYQVQFQLSQALTTDLTTQATIAQQAFVSNVVTFAVVAPATATASTRRPVSRSKRR
ncbi:MAG TPA: hypothetical protein VN519_11255 [Bryobacteraceae bacterium]|nr:hypothetical protein [Bryobacteraceae bacterium]